MKLLGSTKSKIHLEITEVVLVHWNVTKNDYQKNSRVLYTFGPNKSLAQLFDIPPETKSFHILKYGLLIKIEPIEDKINITLVTK